MVAWLGYIRAAWLRRLVWLAIAGLLAPAIGPGPALASKLQRPADFFETLISIFATADPPPTPGSRANPLFPYAGRSDQVENPQSDAYRTVCVRLCDGYYWPVSDAAPMSRFQRDRDNCESSCETPARLYYQPRGQTDAGRLVSLDGKPYAMLPQAFSYRTSLNPACRCKPDPWSDSETERHRQYALDGQSYDAVSSDAAVAPPADEAASAEATPIEDTDVQAGNPAAKSGAVQ